MNTAAEKFGIRMADITSAPVQGKDGNWSFGITIRPRKAGLLPDAPVIADAIDEVIRGLSSKSMVVIRAQIGNPATLDEFVGKAICVQYEQISDKQAPRAYPRG